MFERFFSHNLSLKSHKSFVTDNLTKYFKRYLIIYSPSCLACFLMWDLKEDNLKNVPVALFHAVTANRDWSFQLSKSDIKVV